MEDEFIYDPPGNLDQESPIESDVQDINLEASAENGAQEIHEVSG